MGRDPARQPVGEALERLDAEVSVDELSASQRRDVCESVQEPAQVRAQLGTSVGVEGGQQQVAALARKELGDQQGGQVTLGASYLQDLGHRDDSAHQAQQGRIDVDGPRTTGSGATAVDPDDNAFVAGPGDERLAAEASREGRRSGGVLVGGLLGCHPTIVAGARGSKVAAWNRTLPSGSNAGPWTNASPGSRTGMTGTPTPTSTSPPTAASSAMSGSSGARRASGRSTSGCSAT